MLEEEASPGRPPPIRVLLVEDDPEIARRLGAALTNAGFVVENAADGETGLLLGQTNDFDAVVLDLGLPRLPGLEVLKQWRREGRDVPVLVLTARDAWTDRVEGLNAGADDYLGKPFQNAEVVARLRALTRRSAGRSSPVMRRGDIMLDPVADTVQRGEETIELTARELNQFTDYYDRQHLGDAHELTAMLRLPPPFAGQSEATEVRYADGRRAVIIQHELDHLDGILFIDHISSLKRDIYKRKLKKMQKEDADD